MAKPAVKAKSSKSPSPSRSSGSSSFSGSSSASGSRSRSLSSSSHSGSSSRSRSPPPKKSDSVPAGRKLRSVSPPARKASPAKKLRTPTPESTVLHIGCLTRNVKEGHLREIFGNYGDIVNLELAMDRSVNLPKGFGYVEFKSRVDAEKAQAHMDGGQIDGNVVSAQFILVPRKKPSPPSRPAPSPLRKDNARVPLRDGVKDGGLRRGRDSPPMARRRSPSPPPRRRSMSPRRVGRGDSPPRRRPQGSPSRRGRSPSPIRRRRRSPIRSPPPRRGRSPVGRMRSPVSYRRRSPLPPRRGGRTPSRRSSPPVRRRSRSPPRRPVRSRSRSRSAPRRYMDWSVRSLTLFCNKEELATWRPKENLRRAWYSTSIPHSSAFPRELCTNVLIDSQTGPGHHRLGKLDLALTRPSHRVLQRREPPHPLVLPRRQRRRAEVPERLQAVVVVPVLGAAALHLLRRLLRHFPSRK